MEKELFEYHVAEAQKIYPKYDGENGKRFIDLSGQTFYELTVLYRYYKKRNNQIYWVCVCSCGKYTIAAGNNLKNGQHKHCGETIHRIRVDLTGKKIGRWNVIKFLKKMNGEIYYDCVCDCQLELPESERKHTAVRSGNLVYGDTLSCGCLQKEIVANFLKENNKKTNIYDFKSEEYGIGYTENGEKFLFDKEDYDLLENKYWYIKDGYVYNTTRINKSKNISIRFHKMIQLKYNWDQEKEIDHINGVRSDNRKCNLRVVTKQENNLNHKICSRNTSGCTGVGFDKRTNKWKATITKDKKNYWLGYYDNYEDAVKARKEAEEKYFGEYARK